MLKQSDSWAVRCSGWCGSVPIHALQVHPTTPPGWLTGSNLPSSSAEALPPTAHSFRGLHVSNEPLYDLVFLLSHFRDCKDFIHNPSLLCFSLPVCQEIFVISLDKTGQPVFSLSAHSKILVCEKEENVSCRNSQHIAKQRISLFPWAPWIWFCGVGTGKTSNIFRN